MNQVIISVSPDGRMRRADAALYLGLSAQTLANWQTQGKGPKSHLIGSRRFYYLADLEAFVAGASQPVEKTAPNL